MEENLHIYEDETIGAWKFYGAILISHQSK